MCLGLLSEYRRKDLGVLLYNFQKKKNLIFTDALLRLYSWYNLPFSDEFSHHCLNFNDFLHVCFVQPTGEKILNGELI